MSKVSTLKKPGAIPKEAALAFAEGATGDARQTDGVTLPVTQENVPKGSKSGQIPDGDVRLTANIRAELHMALRMRAVQERTTVGELIEAWISSWK
jgi:nicotinamide mononucleotide (NMN) deamidase PncC